MKTTAENTPFTLWPYAVVAVMALFMGYIAMFVYRAMHLEVDLVSTDYYEREIRYQDHINMVGRTKAAGDVAVAFDRAGQRILVQLPESFKGQAIHGKIILFRPSDNALDQELPLQVGRDLSQMVDAAALEKGRWKVRVHFAVGDVAYFAEQAIQVTRP
ncbi:FixH family protein [Pontibacter sp. E15-1]|uniref:FixH family protein n=1 Tax=Pontibacter sp. E15-1 TaxID=2919918 RepID=UPI001F501B10|nr:FixH family protein [Pontibacter sp. E15-1]MCJ8163253.1 FixH family protein [Pontibacter sp. E15-1]